MREADHSIAVVDVNEATLKLYEAETKKQLLGPLDITLDPDAAISFRGLILAIAEGNREFRTESTAKTLRGRKLSLIIHSAIPAENHPYPYMLVSVSDITERARAEREVERLNERMEFILGATKTGLDIIDSRFHLHYVDPEWQKVYGDPSGRTCFEYFMGTKAPCPGCGLQKAIETKAVSVSEEVLPGEGHRLIQVTSVPFLGENGEWLVAEILGKSTSLLIPPGLEEEIREVRDKIARGEQIGHFQTVRKRKDGVLIEVSISLSPIRDAGGKIVGMASVARDITRQKEIVARLGRIRWLENLTTLAGGIAHQFNNINTVVKGYLDLLNREVKPQGQLAVFSQAAAKGIQRAMDITSRLLALTDTSSSRSDLIRMEDVVRSLAPLFQERFTAEKATLAIELTESNPVRMDEKRLETVISAILENALDALADRPVRRVTIRSGNLDGEAFLEVSDTGCGIPSEDITRLFTPFFTAKGEWAPSGSPQEKRKGVGLSLAIANVTISDYDGRIEVRSTPGIGSTFRICLPVAG